MEEKNMARPQKRRKVCDLPQNNRFGPLDYQVTERNTVKMTVDEYETIRLIDLEGLTQEECSAQMNVARTTVQGIYSEARKKIAASLVNGNILLIEGGEYRLCDGSGPFCGGGGCRRRRFGRGHADSK
jgi:predicted DNA-binding protein (UPF0251 family)